MSLLRLTSEQEDEEAVQRYNSTLFDVPMVYFVLTNSAVNVFLFF